MYWMDAPFHQQPEKLTQAQRLLKSQQEDVNLYSEFSPTQVHHYPGIYSQ